VKLLENGKLSGSVKGQDMTENHISFACPHCGQTGEVVWKDDGSERRLGRLSDGFHVEQGRASGARHVIVCDACDEIDSLRTYP
jgi:hypothetical protein